MRLAVIGLFACGSASPPPQKPAPEPEVTVRRPTQPDEIARRAELVAAHRKLEETQQDALAESCPKPNPPPSPSNERCQPSCYPTESPDPRAGKRLAGAVEIQHLVCEAAVGDGSGPFALANELLGAKVVARSARAFPRAHKAGTWQAAVASSFKPGLRRGDVVAVAERWQPRDHAVTGEKLRCVAVSHFTRALRKPLDACGSDGTVACEAIGNAAVRGINVVHYRLVEARRLQTAGKPAECQQAALEAIAVARGLPRWRQYAQLNVGKWVAYAGYRTRFDGILDEDALFTTAINLGKQAEAVHAACGGPPSAPTTAAQEQSFHTCW